MNDPLLIAGLGGYLAGIVRRSGQLVWQHDLHDARANHVRGDTTVIPAAEPPFAAAVSVSSKGGQHVHEWYLRVLCCDYASGRVLWTFELPSGGALTMKPSLQIQDGIVLVGCANVVAFEAMSGRHLWSTSIVPEPSASPNAGFAGALTRMFDVSTPEPWNCQIARRRD